MIISDSQFALRLQRQNCCSAYCIWSKAINLALKESLIQRCGTWIENWNGGDCDRFMTYQPDTKRISLKDHATRFAEWADLLSKSCVDKILLATKNLPCGNVFLQLATSHFLLVHSEIQLAQTSNVNTSKELIMKHFFHLNTECSSSSVYISNQRQSLMMWNTMASWELLASPPLYSVTVCSHSQILPCVSATT